MVPQSCRGAIVLMLVTASLAFGTPALANPSSQGQFPTGGTGAFTTTSGSGDGFQQTVTAFQGMEKKGGEIGAVLQKLHAEAVAGNPGDTAKQQAQFLKKLAELYPGSTYDGTTGTVKFEKDFVATFNNTLNVDSIKELGAITVTYVLAAGHIQLADGVSSVTAVIDRTDPSRSRFIKCDIPSIKEEAEKILSVPGYKRTATDSVETSVLNDAYQLLSLTNALRMDYFAADVMRYPALQSKALGIAGKGYYERHSSEYKLGADPPKPAKKIVETTSSQGPVDIVGLIGRLLITVASTIGVFWIIVVAVRRLKVQFRDNVTKQYIERYNSLSPMVIRSLKKLGTSLWGKNFLWSKKYYIAKRSDRWLLCDGKCGKSGKIFPTNNRLEVCLRDVNFKLKITRLNGLDVDMSVTCKNFSEKELEERLKEIQSLFAEAKTAPVTTAP